MPRRINTKEYINIELHYKKQIENLTTIIKYLIEQIKYLQLKIEIDNKINN